ncbi:MAG: glycerol-3-phosphate 1-O-acyltransferase PlsY [Defluviitaleaceae bacterium]|nr:glycerol-3-phosphate 1-O-acyltransferase PlsY [Defluviitaleaceae bacterium]
MDYRIISLLIGYVLGMIQTGYFVGKLYGIDIRQHGSKNAGMTNVNRILGISPAAVVFVVDILKAVTAFIIATLIFNGGGSFFPSDYVIPGLYAGLGAILGHDFPAYMRFKGGKGISCTLGILLMIDWRAALISYIIGFILVLIFRYISLSSLVMTAIAPVLFFFFGHSMEVVGITAALGALAWFLHRANIQRLFTGTENKFSLSKPKHNTVNKKQSEENSK